MYFILAMLERVYSQMAVLISGFVGAAFATMMVLLLARRELQ
jgi:hypothetical protein